MTEQHLLYAVCAPGLEPYLAQEMRQIGLDTFIGEHPNIAANTETTIEDSGGIEFKGGLEAIYTANYHLRIANRILLRLGDFHAISFIELRKKARHLSWSTWLKPGQPIVLRVTCRKSRLYHSDAVAERVAGAIQDHLGKTSPVLSATEYLENEMAQLVVVRINNDHCTISLDTSGAPLHRRGYRLATAKAPLRETLAAGMLMASGWDTTSPILDPFCGSGTIPIEAALLARQIPPGVSRKFAFMNWKGFKPSGWQMTQKSNTTKSILSNHPVILASDRDAGAIQSAQANAQRGGVDADITFTCQAVSAISPPDGRGWIVANPPYGLRIHSNHDLRDLYAQMGNVFRRKCAGWNFAILCSDGLLMAQMQLPINQQLPLTNGGIRVKLAIGVIPS
jgi:putative N6-adenine-specific DNA methylase